MAHSISIAPNPISPKIIDKAIHYGQKHITKKTFDQYDQIINMIDHHKFSSKLICVKDDTIYNRDYKDIICDLENYGVDHSVIIDDSTNDLLLIYIDQSKNYYLFDVNDHPKIYVGGAHILKFVSKFNLIKHLNNINK